MSIQDKFLRAVPFSALFMLLLPSTYVRAQALAPAAPSAPIAPPSSAPQTSSGIPPSVTPPLAPTFVSPQAVPSRARKVRPLQTTVGLEASTPDLGGEADLVSAAGQAPVRPTYSRRWKYAARAYARVPIIVGLGPRNDGQAGSELHSSARIPGDLPNTWSYTGITHPMNAQLILSAENENMAGHVFLESAASTNSSYANLQALGGISDAYVTFKFPSLLKEYGGAAVNVGVFSHRYGAAGPWQNSTGYYRTSLFGKLQVAGETLVLDFFPNDSLEVIVEHGFGAKFEVIVFTNSTHNPPAPMVPFLQYQGPVPQGSNFVHHAHLALVVKERLRIAGHYMTSWTPNDWRDYGETAILTSSPLRAPEGRLTVFGGEVHFDSERWGSAYLGYSHTKATRILPLSNGLSLINSDFGYDFVNNYFGGVPASVVTPDQFNAVTDSGTIDSLLFQYTGRLAPMLGLPPVGPDLAWAVFSMANVAESAKGKFVKLKYGAEFEANLLRYLAVGIRYDRVAPNIDDVATTYAVISPRVILRSRWLNREYFMLGYSHFLYGANAYVGRPFPYTQPAPYVPRPDPDVLTLSTVVSF